MLRLRTHLLSTVRVVSPLAAASSSVHHLLYSTTDTSPARFVAEEFLVTTCGLTPAQALKSSKHLAHLKSPCKPEAVLGFLMDNGMAKADVAAAIAKDHRILCRKVDTLRPRLAMLRDMDLTSPQISAIISLVPSILSTPGQIRRLEFYLSFLGSYEKVHTALKRNRFLLCRDIERVVKPNIAFLRQCGMKDCDIVKTFSLAGCLLVRVETERLKEIVAGADNLDVPRDSAMFKHALVSVSIINPDKIDSRLDILKKALRCSEAEVHIAVRTFPYILTVSEDKVHRQVDFLIKVVGLEPNCIVRTSILLGFSMRRLLPRHSILEVLKERGLVKKDISFPLVAKQTEKVFFKRFLDPYKESFPGLANVYAAACAGQIPS